MPLICEHELKTLPNAIIFGLLQMAVAAAGNANGLRQIEFGLNVFYAMARPSCCHLCCYYLLLVAVVDWQQYFAPPAYNVIYYL